MNLEDVLIIGAGISGLTAAQKVQELSDSKVLLLDKGRRPGGRFATRRIGGGTFDHGAQFLSVSSRESQDLLEDWQQRSWIRPWFEENAVRFMADKGMNGLAKRVAEGLRVECEVEVERIMDHGEYYAAEGLNRKTNEPFSVKARSLFLTCPLPQTLKLLDAGNVQLKAVQRNELESVKYVPCLAVLMELSGESGLSYKKEPVPGVISWMADNRAKGISETGALTVHMDNMWSARHYDLPDEEILAQAMPSIRTVLGDEPDLLSVQVKRWRYAQATQQIERPFLNVGVNKPLLIGGDACKGDSKSSASKAEHAIRSGLAAGVFLSRL
ncbi:NAD(P)/FAD-dependent oxidoreductase [Metabacillus sp. JX24]|uniref:NAD(P)/FAD-dependent oxidoreductase n=1 Tax=Metabacillus sp. JX24 TaxID=3240759 RepID=UPI00350F9DCC